MHLIGRWQWRRLCLCVWLLLLLLLLQHSVSCHGDPDVITTNPTPQYPSPTPTPSPTPSPTRPPLLPRLLGSQPLYVGSGTIGTQYPDVGVVMMSWTYSQDLIIHNRTVYSLPAQLAFRHIMDSGVLGSRMIRLLLLDDENSSQEAQKNLLTGLIADPQNSTALPLLGVLGSPVAGPSEQLMQLSSTLDVVGVSAAPSFDWIMQKNLYQTVAVTNIQYSRQIDALFALCVTQNWRRMGVLGPQGDTFNTMLAYATTRYANMNQFYALIPAAYIELVPSQPSGYMFLLPTFITSIQGLLKNQVTILILAPFEQQFGQVIYAALDALDLLDNPTYMIIGIGGWSSVPSSLVPAGATRSNIISMDCPPPDPVGYEQMVQQILNRTAINGYNDTEQQQVYEALTDPAMIPVLPYYYDMAFILLSGIVKLYESGVPFTTKTLYSIITNSTFLSPVTGTIRVDNNGMVAVPIGIYQFTATPTTSPSTTLAATAVGQNSSTSNSNSNSSTSWGGSLVGLYVGVNPMSIPEPNNDSETAQQIQTANQQFIWNQPFVYRTADGLPPLDALVTAPATVWYTPASLNRGIYGFTGAVTGLIVLLAVVVWWYRDTLLIRCTQLVWSLLLLFSLAVLAVSTVFYVLSPVDHSWLCDVRPWCTAMSLVCVLVTLLTKVNRIRYIYNNRDISSTREKQGRDTWIFSVLLLPQMVLLVAFSAAKLSTRTTFTSNNIGTNSYTILCTDLETTGWLIWFIFELIYICMLLLALLYMAFSIRHTPSAFNESHHLLSCVFALCVVLAILVPLQFIVNSDPSAVLLVRGIGQPLTALIITIILIGPKIRYLYGGRGNDSSLAEKYHVKGSPALQQDEGIYSSVMETHEGGSGHGYAKHIQQHEYTALFLRCSHLEQQMQRIRALLLKCASDDNMVLNDDMLNLMFTISQLADDVALKHGPFSFSDTTSSFESNSAGLGPGYANDMHMGTGMGVGIGAGIGMPMYQDGSVNQYHTDMGTGMGMGMGMGMGDHGSPYPEIEPLTGYDAASSSGSPYAFAPTAGAGADAGAPGPGPVPASGASVGPGPGPGPDLAAMAVAIKAGQLNPMQPLPLPVQSQRRSFDNKPPSGALTATTPIAPPQPEQAPTDKPVGTGQSTNPSPKLTATAPAPAPAPAPHVIRIASKTDTRHPASFATDSSSYLASRSASASASASASGSAAATPYTETRGIQGSGTTHVPATRDVLGAGDGPGAGAAPMSALAVGLGPSPSAVSATFRYHSYVPSHHSYVSHSHAASDPSAVVSAAGGVGVGSPHHHREHFGSSHLFAAKVHARKHGHSHSHPHRLSPHTHANTESSNDPGTTATLGNHTHNHHHNHNNHLASALALAPAPAPVPTSSARSRSPSDSDSDSREDSRSQQHVSFWE